MDGDAKPDLVVANNDSNTVSVLVNKGDGTFAAPVDFAAGTSPPRSPRRTSTAMAGPTSPSPARAA